MTAAIYNQKTHEEAINRMRNGELGLTLVVAYMGYKRGAFVDGYLQFISERGA